VGADRLTRALAVSLLVLVAAGCTGGDPSPEPSAGGVTATVTRVDDGDTLTLANGAKVRLLQVDAPELTADCYGRQALRALEVLVPSGTRVRLVPDRDLDDHDRYGRLLRYVFVGDTDVNLELVRRGAASPYFFRNDRGAHAGELLDAVEEARDERAGYWGACPGAKLDPGLGSITGPV
jgi:endonuclease YncB( thermonuclease family)